jgi:hypothetical protein
MERSTRRTDMRALRWGLGGVLGALLATGCGGVTAQGVAPARPAAAHRAPTALDAAPRVHSRPAAIALADRALDQVTFPAGSTRLTVRPPRGTQDLNQLLTIDSRVSRTRWWSVPGTAAEVTAWLTAHPPAGLTVTAQAVTIQAARANWSAATPLAFDLAADLVQDGAAVDVSLGAGVTWTPPKTAVETIPAKVTRATLDSTSTTFGTDRRRLVTGAALDQIRAGVNALSTERIGGRLCPAGTGELWTLTLQYDGHIIVVSNGDGTCPEIAITSDGKAQPVLAGYGYDTGDPGAANDAGIVEEVEGLAHATVQGPVPEKFRGQIFSARAADARAVAMLDGLRLPAATTTVPGTNPLYEDRNNDVLTRSRRLHVLVSRQTLTNYLTTHVPPGFIVAHLGQQYDGALLIVEQLAGADPSRVGVTITLEAAGVVDLDATALWSPSRSAAETIPTSTRSALLTYDPYPVVPGLPSRRVDYHGAGLVTLIDWLNNRPAMLYGGSCPSGRATTEPPAKLGATFHVGARVVTFYWYTTGCQVIAVVNGKHAPYLSGAPTAIVEALLHVRRQG